MNHKLDAIMGLNMGRRPGKRVLSSSTGSAKKDRINVTGNSKQNTANPMRGERWNVSTVSGSP
jgi:hypothetical protein